MPILNTPPGVMCHWANYIYIYICIPSVPVRVQQLYSVIICLLSSHWSQVMQICFRELSHHLVNGSASVSHQAISWNSDELFSIKVPGRNFGEIWIICNKFYLTKKRIRKCRKNTITLNLNLKSQYPFFIIMLKYNWWQINCCWDKYLRILAPDWQVG